MNFSEDPLTDLLSDNSLDTDNFFDLPATSNSKKLSKSNKTKGKIEDLFGIREESEPDVQNSAAGKQIHSSTPRIVKQKPSLSMDDADVDLGFDPKRPKSSGMMKRNIFDDLLGVADHKKSIFDDILLSNEATKRPGASKPSMSRQSTDSTTDNSNMLSQARQKNAVSAGRRSSVTIQSANPIAEPLNIFSRESHAKTSEISTPKKVETADWLGLGTKQDVGHAAVGDELESVITPLTPKSTKEVSALPKNTADILQIPESSEPQQKAEQLHPTVDNTAETILMLNSLNLENNHSYSALQQQDVQIKIAGRMKDHERALLEMQQRQEAHDRKFQALLQQQLHRQQQMNELIKAQQDRINDNLQLMIGQPVVAHTAAAFSDSAEHSLSHMPTGDGNIKEDCEEKLLQLETDVKRYVMEKQRLEELVAIIRANYEQEIQIMQISHKKQITVLEQHLTAVEQRLKAENSETRDYYTEKLKNLKIDYDLEISSLKEDHAENLRKLRIAQDAEMERIKQAKILEQAIIQDHGSYLETLRLAASNLQELREGVTSTQERDKQFELRERRLEDVERRLKIDAEIAEQEKRRLMELVSTLELQLEQISKDSAEENWQLRQRMASIDSEKKAFEKEKQFHREQIERNEKRIAELKALQLAEFERLHMDIQQERTRLLLEQQKIEMQQKLQGSGDLDRERLELEAQLQVARDAIKQANDQRDRCFKQQQELEQRKRLLLDKENELNIKKDEVLQAASLYSLGIKRLNAAEHKTRESEQLLHSKLQLLSKRSNELSEKEAQLSQERMLVSQDRIALQKMKQKISRSKCALCKMGIENLELSHSVADCKKGKLSSSAVNQVLAKSFPRIIQEGHQPTSDIVDRLLDENIDASYRKMFCMTESEDMDYWSTVGLDDDSKKLVLNNGSTLGIEDLIVANINISQ